MGSLIFNPLLLLRPRFHNALSIFFQPAFINQPL